MYPFIWRHLPGPFAVRLVLAVLIAAAVVLVLFVYVFPLVAPLVTFNGNTVGGT